MQITLDGLQKHYGTYHALKSIDLAVPAGQFVALVGPSGCGKSTLLRTIAGLEAISAGTLRIAGEDVTRRPPRQRDVAMVFQSYALYPHMTVAENMGYALKLRRLNRTDIARRTQVAAATLGLEALLGRYPRELSGGQRQRVAMGRAIVRDPKVFLFDEPLSNLDAALRVHMRGELRDLHDRLAATSVYVTHDQIEAMTMADHVVVMRAGRIEQQGRPLDLYDRPASRFVAGFIGSPAMNILPGTVDPSGRAARLDGAEGPLLSLPMLLEPGRPVLLGLRPEHLRLSQEGGARFDGVVDHIESTGSTTFVKLKVASQAMVMTLARRLDVTLGDPMQIGFDPADLHIFDRESEASLVTQRDAPPRAGRA
ncbi:ABC transporter ATP-binding protein [Lichenifustis flavocetrariae]|uniref:Sn-glycerol-3-phosphate ABC transporter ATP-binding protein UgpC n=1 Tax=Lichenifustis flavocetrariae TaxID=2949735 RepID=A0AA42CLM9_9HYPH|nr:sn-glycerol-3-phosphate ABC transporter ATP-binding protein UgpC [Lichenifustis flavocetrariae]MCW6507475.1 sn-glycerol-3-phosphate ABC transporter ATP-binding protein UgpC [Lichenifustis flavocetrariae]